MAKQKKSTRLESNNAHRSQRAKRKPKVIEPIETTTTTTTTIGFGSAESDGLEALADLQDRTGARNGLYTLLIHAEHTARATIDGRLAPKYSRAARHSENIREAKSILRQVEQLRALLGVRPDNVGVAFETWWLATAVARLTANLAYSEGVNFVRTRELARAEILARNTATDEEDRKTFSALAGAFITKQAERKLSYASVKAHIVRVTGTKPGRVERLYPRRNFKSVRS